MGEDTKKTLINIVQDQSALDQLMLETGGEITDKDAESIVTVWIEEIKKDLATKADNYEFRQRSLESMAERMNEYSKKFSQAAKSIDRVSNSLKERMKQAMIEMNTTEIKGNVFRYKLSQSKPSVVITDESKLSAEYLKEKVVLNIDKEAIRKDVLENNKQLEGVSIERGFSIRSYVNKGE